ncbi:MAG: recombinase family protein, partial [Terriglobales bacterium]
MRSIVKIPAAQYVRMSTEDQLYSIANQQSAIQKYAEENGYVVVSTYADNGKSGVAISRRTGLRQLLKDVMSGQATFKTILVYDVSRWGRFQDTDEAAHYEFLCKAAGAPVRYCAEQFENDGTLPSSIMKSLKRTMAAEYSRELGVKVSEGQRRLVRLGFRVCGNPGWGLRRMMVSPDGRRRFMLESGDRKAIKSDHTILVPGPKREVDIIKEIFALATHVRNTPSEIARQLNHRNIKFVGDRPWDEETVYRILKKEKYSGCSVYGKTSKRLSSPVRKLPRSQWVISSQAFLPIVAPERFARVQRVLHMRDKHARKPEEYLLNRMRKVLLREGKL